MKAVALQKGAQWILGPLQRNSLSLNPKKPWSPKPASLKVKGRWSFSHSPVEGSFCSCQPPKVGPSHTIKLRPISSILKNLNPVPYSDYFLSTIAEVMSLEKNASVSSKLMTN